MKTFFLSLLTLLGGFLPAQDANHFTVGTFNIRFNNPADGVNAWTHRKDLVKGLIRFHHWDLFGVQEALLDQIQDLEALGEYGRVGSGRDDGVEAGEFAALFYRKSRWELLDSGTFWLSPTPEIPTMGWDARCCKRICTWARFRDRTIGRQLVVFNAHFDHQGVTARLESARLMDQKARELAGDLPVILMGDFNDIPESPAIEILLKAGYRDSRAHSAQAPYGPEGTFNGFNWEAALDRRIDYIFLGSSLAVEKYGVLSDSYGRRYPSDHLPVQVLLHWKP